MTVLTRPEGTLPADLHVSRRGLAGLVALGYAAAGAGADAAPIVTGAEGLLIETVTMPGGLPGYVARPRTQGRHPVVIKHPTQREPFVGPPLSRGKGNRGASRVLFYPRGER